MTHTHRRLVSVGLFLIAAGLLLRAMVPNAEKGGADFFMGALIGAGVALESVALWLARATPSPRR